METHLSVECSGEDRLLSVPGCKVLIREDQRDEPKKTSELEIKSFGW